MMSEYTERLFSYGTLQTETVQLSLFGRRLEGEPDALVGYCLVTIHVQDQSFVAHSGAGPLLPAIRQSLANPVHAYVFVDAGIPRDGLSRLDLMKSEDPAWAEQFQEELARGERFPAWSFEDLQEVIPDEELRRQTVADKRVVAHSGTTAVASISTLASGSTSRTTSTSVIAG